jgi:hypothetical protein
MMSRKRKEKEKKKKRCQEPFLDIRQPVWYFFLLWADHIELPMVDLFTMCSTARTRG